MKAVVINDFGGPEQLIVTELPIPEPKENEILLENKIIGVGKPEFLIRSGNDPYLRDKLPGLVIGNESLGIVKAVGSQVKNFKVGDHAALLSGTGCGSHAEYSCGEERFAIPLPKEVPFENMAGVLNLQVAYALIHDAGKGTDGQSMYMKGAAGGIGTIMVQVAKAAGMKVIVSASTEEKCAVLRELGADHVFNYKEASEKDEIMKATDGLGVDLVFDQLAGPDFAAQFEYLADFGMIVLYNWMKVDPCLDQIGTIIKEAPHAHAVRSFSYHVFDRKTERRMGNASKVLSLVAEGKVKSYIGASFPLEEARKAHELLDAGTTIGKIIMVP